MAYSTVADLLNGNIPLPAYLVPQKYVDDASDEIDSKIGHIYLTPINITENGPTPRTVRLLLKRINNFLATGRLLMAVDAGGEDDRLHAYGYSLVQEATLALAQIASGEIPLEGVPPNPSTVGTGRVTSVIVDNLDAESHVEAFYDRVLNPAFAAPYTIPAESERAWY